MKTLKIVDIKKSVTDKKPNEKLGSNLLSFYKVTGNLTRLAVHLKLTLDSMENSVNCFDLRIWDIFSYFPQFLLSKSSCLM